MENGQERKHLREYREAFEKLKTAEQKRDAIAVALKTVEPDSAGAASLRESLRQLEETIARYESRLAKLETSKPLQALLKRLRQKNGQKEGQGELAVANITRDDIIDVLDASEIEQEGNLFLSAEKRKEVFEAAKSGGRHKGVYHDAIKKTEAQLRKSIKSRQYEVDLHRRKVASPAAYDADWKNKTSLQRDGLIRKWKKDMVRNAEQAAIEIEVYKERFENE